jgi:hypothetical protein
MLQPRQDDLLARLLNLAGQEDLVQDGVDFVEVKDEVQLANVAEEGVKDLDEEVDGLEVGELVVVGVDAGAEEEARVAAVDDLVVPVLDKVGLVLLVARRHESVYLALELDLLFVAVGCVPLGQAGLASGKGELLADVREVREGSRGRAGEVCVLPILDQDERKHCGDCRAARCICVLESRRDWERRTGCRVGVAVHHGGLLSFQMIP